MRAHLTAAVVIFVVTAAGCRGRDRQPDHGGGSAGSAGGSGSAAGPEAPDEKLAWPAIDEAALVAATAGLTRGRPEPIGIAPDGAVVYLRSQLRDGAAELYDSDGKAEPRLLAAAPALLGGGATAGGITRAELAAGGGRVLALAGERVFAIDRATGAARELALGPGAVIDPQLSPDGARVVFARDGDVWVAEVGGPPPVRIAQHAPEREYGVADPASRDALGRTRAMWWSPDGQSIVFQRTDARAVGTLYIADPAHPERAPAAVRSPRPGKPIATVDLGIVGVRGGAPRWVGWDLARWPYLSRVIWPARGPLTLLVANRAQTELAALAVEPATGATRTLLIDKDPAWIEVTGDPLTWLVDGSGFLWMSESSGSWSLELHAADGAHQRTVLTADNGPRRVAGLTGDGRDVIVETAVDPREQHVWRVPLAGGKPIPLTSGGGVHRAIAGHGVVVISSRLRDGGGGVAALRGEQRRELPVIAEPPGVVPTTRLERVVIDQRMVYGAVTRPRALAPGVRYPVLLIGAPGPSSKLVTDARDHYLLDQWYADAGFVVLRVDGSGTADRGRDWSRAVSTDLITAPMTDQLAALKRVGARYPELDSRRIGVMGEGVGGYFALMAVLLHPDVFAAAAASSPYVDWELADAATAERYLRTPELNAEGYRRVSALTYVDRLIRPLLVLHAATDRRVHFSHAIALSEALYGAGRRAELVALPAGRAEPDLARERLQLEFFRTALGPPVRPAVMPEAKVSRKIQTTPADRP